MLVVQNTTPGKGSIVSIEKISEDSVLISTGSYNNITEINQFRCETLKNTILMLENDENITKYEYYLPKNETDCFYDFLFSYNYYIFRYNNIFYSINTMVS